MGELVQELRTEADVALAAEIAGVPTHAFAVGQTVMHYSRPSLQGATAETDPATYLGVEYLPD